MHPNKERRGKGRGAPRAVEVINLGLATDCIITTGVAILFEETGKILISKEGRFDKGFFPRRNRQKIDDHLTNLADIDVVRLSNGGMKWIN